MNKDKKVVRIKSTSKSRTGDGVCECNVTNLTDDEMDMMDSFLLGRTYLSINDRGRLVSTPIYEDLPDPLEDDMKPFWRKWEGSEICQQSFKQFDIPSVNGHMPAIIIMGLCAYNYTPENYEEHGNRLTEYGFELYRTQRGKDGKYSEKWILNFLMSAKGDLKDAIAPPTDDADEELKRATDFLARNISFGSLEVATQRMAAVID